MSDPTPEQILIRDRLLGWGMAFTPVFPGLDLGRDIRLEKTARGTDFAVVRSLDNLAQDRGGKEGPKKSWWPFQGKPEA